MNTHWIAKKSRILFVTVSALLIGAVSSVSAASPQQRSVHVVLEVRPSAECMPVSSLQEKELQSDFASICPDCAFEADSREASDYRVVVEDPFLSWLITVSDSEQRVLQVYKWSGSLDIGLRRTADFLHRHLAGAGEPAAVSGGEPLRP